MELTPFAPIFVLLMIYAFFGPRQWFIASLVGCFFQAASPITMPLVSRAFGIGPAYAMLPIGVLHWFRMGLAVRPTVGRKLSSTFWWLAAFVLCLVLGGLLLPRLFDGEVHVLPPRVGRVSGLAEVVHPGRGNLIQSVYGVANFLICCLGYYFAKREYVVVRDLSTGLALGSTIAVFVGVYQVAAHAFGWYWPSSVFNSNAGYLQLFTQTAGPLRRMSATFMEPSILAYYFLAAFGYFAIGLSRTILGGSILVCLLLSTSTSAYIGLVAMFIVWSLTRQKEGEGRLIAAGAFTVILSIGIALDQFVLKGFVLKTFLLEKPGSESGLTRIAEDSLAIRTFVESHGMGVGIGSARASSLLSTLLATTGVAGVVLFTSLFVSALRRAWSAPITEGGRPIFFALVGCLIVWGMSVPDLSFPLPWFLIAIAVSLSDPPASAGGVSAVLGESAAVLQQDRAHI